MFKFNFYQSDSFNKKRFQKKIDAAIRLIEGNKSDIAKKVLKVIRSKEIAILSFFELAKKEHFLEVRSNHIGEESLKKGSLHYVPRHFPPEKSVVHLIEHHLEGIRFNDNHIYLKSKLSIKKMAEALIHEVAHHLNYSLLQNDLEAKSELSARLLDEIRSYTAERFFEKNGLPFLRSDVINIRRKVCALHPEFIEADNKRQALGFHPGHAV